MRVAYFPFYFCYFLGIFTVRDEQDFVSRPPMLVSSRVLGRTAASGHWIRLRYDGYGKTSDKDREKKKRKSDGSICRARSIAVRQEHKNPLLVPVLLMPWHCAIRRILSRYRGANFKIDSHAPLDCSFFQLR
jgi:YD repeat-containing protein